MTLVRILTPEFQEPEIDDQDLDAAEKQLERDVWQAIYNLQCVINRADELDDRFDRAFLARLLYEAETALRRLLDEVRQDEITDLDASWNAT